MDNKKHKITINDLHLRNRETRRKLYKKSHKKVFPGESWDEVNKKVLKRTPYINPSPKVFKYNPKKHHI